jgi:RimJ/RimL family protein N-acetyltransferase
LAASDSAELPLCVMDSSPEIGHHRRVSDAIASDGHVTLRAFRNDDRAALIGGRDAEFERWLGVGSTDPAPTACIIVDGELVGWVDYDIDRDWLESGEVNIGYNVFAEHRRRGYATSAVALLIGHLARATSYRTATLLINADNIGSLAVAAALCFDAHGDIDGSRYFKLPIHRAKE